MPTTIPNPHKLGVHKLIKHISLNALFDSTVKARLHKAVNIANLRLWHLLAQIAKAIKKRLGGEIIMDGGVQCGTDIFKALTLGADVLGVGASPFLARGQGHE